MNQGMGRKVSIRISIKKNETCKCGTQASYCLLNLTNWDMLYAVHQTQRTQLPAVTLYTLHILLRVKPEVGIKTDLQTDNMRSTEHTFTSMHACMVQQLSLIHI